MIDGFDPKNITLSENQLKFFFTAEVLYQSFREKLIKLAEDCGLNGDMEVASYIGACAVTEEYLLNGK